MLRNDGALINAFQSISNRLSGFGGSRDPASAIEINSVQSFSEETLSAIYRGYKLIQKIIDSLPEDANAKEIVIKQGKNAIDTNAILSQWRKIEVNCIDRTTKGVASAFVEAGILARLYGNAYIIIGVNDGQEDYSNPIDINNIKSIEWLAVRDKTQIKPIALDRNRYQVILDNRNQLPKEGATNQIHASRILRFHGTKLRGHMTRLGNQLYEDDSIIQSIFNEFTAYIMGLNSGASMLNSHSIFKYKLNGLAQLTKQQNTEDLKNRFQSILYGLSSIRGLVFDAQNEDAEFINRNYGGVDSIIIAIRDIFVAVSGMPHSLLFGSPIGGAFSESGASDRYMWANTIERYQRNQLLSLHTELLRLSCLAKESPTNGFYPEDLLIEYPSSLQLTRKEIAQLKKMNAETDKIYSQLGALSSSEIRNRFSGAEYSDEIVLSPKTEFSTELTKSDSVEIEGNKIRIRGKILPLSEYGESDDENTIED